jgi:hypothetical protein
VRQLPRQGGGFNGSVLEVEAHTST